MKLDERWLSDAARDALGRLGPERRKRLAARLSSLWESSKTMRSAASGEEPLFAPELEREAGP